MQFFLEKSEIDSTVFWNDINQTPYAGFLGLGPTLS
jgi:hypothetical protein